MSVPVPVTISIAPPPMGWTAQAPNLFQSLATLVAGLMSGTITASFLTGQVGGSAPSSDIGPWANGNEWWFWDAAANQYEPSQQGCPVGAMMMWGAAPSSSVPPRWLHCDGNAVPISAYPRLYNAIGTTWGSGGSGYFKLPPRSVMFLNAAGFSPDGISPYDASKSPDGQLFITGGKETAMLTAKELPACKISIPFVNTQMITGTTNQPNIQSPGNSKYSYPVTDENGNVLGNQQQAISTMPPFVVVHYIIKYM